MSPGGSVLVSPDTNHEFREKEAYIALEEWLNRQEALKARGLAADPLFGHYLAFVASTHLDCPLFPLGGRLPTAPDPGRMGVCAEQSQPSLRLILI